MKNYILFLLCMNWYVLLGQSQDQNYVLDYIYKEPRTINNLNTENRDVLIKYFDGLGNIKQIVQNSKDQNHSVVMDMEYDQKFRLRKAYLAYPNFDNNINFKNNSINEGVNYYTSNYNDGKNYSEYVYEKNSFDRISKNSSPGSEWQIASDDNDRTIKNGYGLSTITDSVKVFKISNSWDASKGLFSIDFNFNGYYPDGILFKKIIKDENWKYNDENKYKTVEFYDSNNRLYLKRKYNNFKKIDTYFVYDTFGNLSVVIPPSLAKKQNLLLSDLLNSGYVYYFDNRNRKAQSKLPNRTIESYAYDKSDRIVLKQDEPNQGKRWFFYKYDALNRIVYDGFFANTASRGSMQNALNSMNSNNTEVRTNQAFNLNNLNVFYTKVAFPTGSMTINNVYYYDSYENLDVDGFEAYNGHTLVVNPTDLKGQILVEHNRNFSEDNYLQKNYYYDKNFDLPLKIEKKYDDNTYSIVRKSANFDGTIYKEEFRQKFKSLPELNITKEFTYKDNKVKNIKYNLNGNDYFISNYDYDYRGLIKSKKLGGNNIGFSSALSSSNYSYNIRGWLTSINNVEEDNHLFSQEVGYYNGGKFLPNFYNGTITNTSWKTLTNNEVKRYLYGYDGLYQLTYSSLYDYFIYNGTIAGIAPTDEYLENYTYDSEGNILSLIRNGKNINNQNIEIDNLSFEYNDNKLVKVSDISNHIEGFKDNYDLGSEDDFLYDSNGNLIQDNNNKIILSYDHLNLTTEIRGEGNKKTVFGYLSDGTKVKESHYDNGVLVNEIAYIDGFKYINNDLKTIDHEEGYFEKIGSDFYATYLLKDYLGNNRVIFRDGYDNRTGSMNLSLKDGIINQFEVLNEYNYYPSGLKHVDSNSLVTDSNVNRSFSDKETLDKFHYGIYDFGFRMYNSTIARWQSPDPFSEKYYNYNNYNFVLNNPINLIDKYGLYAESFYDDPPENSNYAGEFYQDSQGMYVGVEGGGWYAHYFDEDFTEILPNLVMDKTDASPSFFSGHFEGDEYIWSMMDYNDSFHSKSTGLSFSHRYSVGQARAETTIKPNFLSYNGKVSMASAEWKLSSSTNIGSVPVSSTHKVSGDLFTASANATAGVFLGEKSKIGFDFSLGASAHVAKADYATTIQIGSISIEMSRGIGYGASAEAGLSFYKDLGTGETVFKGFESLGIKGTQSLSLEVRY